MLPLPVPAEGGSIEALASLCNISGRSDFLLVPGSWPDSGTVAHTLSWRSRASRAPPRPCSRKCFGP
jgi:hypothetical protein